jgi:hypothetical protein
MGKGVKPFVGKTCRYLSNVKSSITTHLKPPTSSLSSGGAVTFSVNQGDPIINLLGGSSGKEFYEPRRRYQLYFWFRPHHFWQR